MLLTLLPALTGNEDAVEYQNKLKEISKTEEYKNFIQQKLQRNSLLVNQVIYIRAPFYGIVIYFNAFYDTKKRNCRSYIWFWPTVAVQNQKVLKEPFNKIGN
jgi:hypothetical protein